MEGWERKHLRYLVMVDISASIMDLYLDVILGKLEYEGFKGRTFQRKWSDNFP